MALKPHHQAEGTRTRFFLDPLVYFFPRDFNIVWGNDTRYWRLPKKDEVGPAELVKVSWLEVHKELRIETIRKYEISFKVSLKNGHFGWENCPVYLMAKFGKKGKYSWRKIDLSKEVKLIDRVTDIPQQKFEIEIPIRRRGDDADAADDNILYFGLYEVWTGIAKGGLLIHYAEVK